jgi:prolyl-tRNA editing enzyme YbaK/EbsC (Cys-tRNA(Pro) deacylase)
VVRSPLPESATRVQEHLKAQGSSAQVLELPAGTRTAVEAAQAIGCSVSQIAKSIVFRAAQSGRPVLAVASGSHRVDETVIANLLGEPSRRPARTSFAKAPVSRSAACPQSRIRGLPSRFSTPTC